ncbi:MAG: 16S rRNA (adenine(1518)-N(6)/adenine(1519)-N(6))-dimethyltransferase RsmA [Armatimonadota bacterium]|jgi:16S rRNA (adenine1518-N6/adenine1519-N6)-dimethyltransferase
MHESARAQLRRLGIRPDRSLGQHFLINEGAADCIVEAALEPEPEGIVEIGPGLGVLTRRLVEAGVPVIAFEMDEDMRPELERIGRGHPNLQVRYQDVLDARMGEITASPPRAGERGGDDAAPPRWVAVGNIPYQITSPLLGQLLTTEPPFAAIVLMIQREVGRRLAAAPGTKDYGALTLLARFYAGQPEVVAELTPASFEPPPKVHSIVLRLTPRTPPIAEPPRRKLFFTVVRAAFGQRRKQIANALSGSPHLPIEKAEAKEALARAGITTSRRGETLSLEEFVALTRAVEEVRG